VHKRQFYQIVESNRIEKLIRQRESNRIELFFPESECSNKHPIIYFNVASGNLAFSNELNLYLRDQFILVYAHKPWHLGIYVRSCA